MDQALRLYGRVVRSTCIIAGWALMAISVATCIEIITRKFFGFTFKGLDEIGGNMLAGISALGFAYALTTRAHMRVTILFGYIASSLQAILNVVAFLTLSAMAVFCAWRGVFEFLDSFGSGKRSNTPLQALHLANDPAFIEFFTALGKRMETEGPREDSGKIGYGFRLCFGREPTEPEKRRLLAYLESQRKADEKTAWASIARVLMNLDEFVTRE